ncbi:hypothetical protein N9R04_08055 [Staphylococcus sp. SQ8-PEA]|uniref:Uncharacterized protein n=1 Tax=Staphylococcus marylandisciuri TaxID=2981529 RepID=A0ABT2QRP7_9STAP|nr:hypothetical protein [Staphylococcus marylandisciuri]MCU5746661.1 hypothetical protein [Staphylococcus marylandisciuri]
MSEIMRYLANFFATLGSIIGFICLVNILFKVLAAMTDYDFRFMQLIPHGQTIAVVIIILSVVLEEYFRDKANKSTD